MLSKAQFTKFVKKEAARLGFDLVKIIPAPDLAEDARRYEKWLEKGYAGQMSYLSDFKEKKVAIEKLDKEIKSVIVLGLNYYQKIDKDVIARSAATKQSGCISTGLLRCARNDRNTTGLLLPRSARGRNDREGKEKGDFVFGARIARYAFGRDYHKIISRKLKLLIRRLEQIVIARPKVEAIPRKNILTTGLLRCARNDNYHASNDTYRFYVDTGPVLERALAKQAGLGFVGKNTNIINKKYGSWLLLAEIFTNAEFEYDQIESDEKESACGSCRKCIDICPTGALKNAYELDARLCISYLTIENRGDIPVELRPKIGNWLFGCDMCQEICPFNKFSQITKEPEMLTWRAGAFREVEEILRIRTEEEFLKKFAGTPLVRAKRRGLLRNAAVVAGNFKDARLLPVLLEVLNEESDEMVRRHAGWAVRTILRLSAHATLPF